MRRLFILLGLVLVIASCSEENYSYTYLVEHPKVLKKEMDRCYSLKSKSEEQAKQCEIIMYAAATFEATYEEQQKDPEKFGMRLMTIQNEYAATKKRLEAAKVAIQKKGTPEEIKVARDNLEGAQGDYKEKLDQMNLYLAVIGINSPE